MQSLSWRCEQVAWADSTQDLVAARRAEHQGLAIWTTDQRAGRGRAQRVWVSPPGTGVALSLLLKPDPSGPVWPWYSLMLSCAAAKAITEYGVLARVKWPNDVLVGERKIAGVLATALSESLILGIGINTSMTVDQLPEPRATSLAIEGVPDALPNALVDDVLKNFSDLLKAQDWLGIYRNQCVTLGADVEVQTPTGKLVGQAIDISPNAELVLRVGNEDIAVSVGDVTHVR